MKKSFKSMNDSQYHFSLRKMSVGVCSVVLGLFFVGANNAQVVKADDVNPAVVQQTENQSKTSQATTPVQKEQVKDVKDVAENQKSEEANSNVSNKVEEPKVEKSVVTENKTNLSTDVSAQTKESVDSQKAVSNVEQKNANDVQVQDQSAETTTFNLINFDLNSNDKSVNANSLLTSMFYYVPYGGWENHNGKMYYRDWDGNYLRNQWAAPTGTTHYFGREGYTISNQWYTMPDNNTYYFDNTGHTVKNRWYTLPNTRTYYFDNIGHTVKNRWYTITSGRTYYFDTYGHTVKNRWYNIANGRTYYFDTYGHTVRNRWYNIPNSRTYYFDNFGHTVKNRWYNVANGGTYYFDHTGHTVKNRWYNIPNGGTYYFDNEGHTVKNRYYTLNGTRYWFDNNGHTKFADRYIKQNGLTIDTKDMTLSGKRNGSSWIFVLDPSGNEEKVTWNDGGFSFDASKYAGETITLITRNGTSTDDREVAPRQNIWIPQQSMTDITVSNSSTNVSGKTNGNSWIFVLDPSGNEQEKKWSDGTFDFDASEYAGETITLIARNGSSTDDREVAPRQRVWIPQLSVTDIAVDNRDSYVSGKTSGDCWLFVVDPSSGNEEEVTWSDGSFGFDASKYAGETITLIARNDSSTDSREVAPRKSIWIPYL